MYNRKHVKKSKRKAIPYQLTLSICLKSCSFPDQWFIDKTSKSWTFYHFGRGAHFIYWLFCPGVYVNLVEESRGSVVEALSYRPTLVNYWQFYSICLTVMSTQSLEKHIITRVIKFAWANLIPYQFHTNVQRKKKTHNITLLLTTPVTFVTFLSALFSERFKRLGANANHFTFIIYKCVRFIMLLRAEIKILQ